MCSCCLHFSWTSLNYTVAALGLVLHFSVLCCLKTFLQLLTPLWKKKKNCFLCSLLWHFCLWFWYISNCWTKANLWFRWEIGYFAGKISTQHNQIAPLLDFLHLFNGLVKANFCHPSDFTLMVVHLVKVIQDSMCVLVWNAPTNL